MTEKKRTPRTRRTAGTALDRDLEGRVWSSSVEAAYCRAARITPEDLAARVRAGDVGAIIALVGAELEKAIAVAQSEICREIESGR